MIILIQALRKPAVALVLGLASLAAISQTPTTGAFEVVPAQPTSFDTIFLKIPRACTNQFLVAPGYRTSAVNGKIRVELFIAQPPACSITPAVLPALFIEIGRLPAGSYALDIVEVRQAIVEVVVISIVTNASIVVGDQRAAKTSPAVRLNYSDHWWDAANSGSGLFIWQDARDQVLAAWFTYGADGKASWYTIQGGAWTTATRYEGKLVQTSRFPNTSLPAPIEGSGPTVAQAVGTASLDFSGDDGALAGVFTYQLDGTSTISRNIRRFNK